MITEQQIRDILRSGVHSEGELAIAVLFELLNDDLTIDELKSEIAHEITRRKRIA